MKLNSALEGLVLGEVRSYKNIGVVPVLGKDRVQEELRTLDQVLRNEPSRKEFSLRAPLTSLFGKRRFSVTESHEQDSVLIDNALDYPVFIAGGMTFEGETQHRAALYPAVIQARSGVLKFPVHCVEQNKPLSEKGTRFTRSSSIVLASARTGNQDQKRTWDTVTRLSGFSQSRERRAASFDYVSLVQGVDLGAYLKAFGEPVAHQIGYLAAIRGNEDIFFYGDVFGNHRLYAKLHQRLQESVAAVAKVMGNNHLKAEKDAFAAFLDSVREVELPEKLGACNVDGKLYEASEPVAAVSFLYKERPLQLSLRKDCYHLEKEDSDPCKTMLFTPRQVRNQSIDWPHR